MSSDAYQRSPCLYLESNNVKIGSNRDAGGGVTELIYKSLYNFINIVDLGRMCQTATFWSTNGVAYNPDECGAESNPGNTPNLNSPCLVLENQGGTQVSLCNPKEWLPGVFGPGYVYDWIKLGKHATIIGDGIVKYQTDVINDRSIQHDGLYQVEIPSIYTVQQMCRYYGYDAASSALEEFQVGNFVSGDINQYHKQYSPPSGSGGVIVSSPDQLWALGIYGAQGAVDYFTLWSFINAPPGGNQQLEWPCSKLTAVKIENANPLPAGTYAYTSYLIMGTVGEVQSKMRALFTGAPLPQAGGNPPPPSAPAPTSVPAPTPTVTPTGGNAYRLTIQPTPASVTVNDDKSISIVMN